MKLQTEDVDKISDIWWKNGCTWEEACQIYLYTNSKFAHLSSDPSSSFNEVTLALNNANTREEAELLIIKSIVEQHGCTLEEAYQVLAFSSSIRNFTVV